MSPRGEIRPIRPIGPICLICLISHLSPAAFAAPDVIGWRTDTTGYYPDATPPLTWGPDTNVAWATDMPSWSDSTPVIAGDRIFVTAEPFWLLCVNKADGKVLWKKSHETEKLVDLTARKRSAEERKKAAELKVASLKKELAKIASDIKKTWSVKMDDTSDDGLGLEDDDIDDEGPADDTKAREARTKILKQKQAELTRQVTELERQAATVAVFKAKKPLKQVGYSCCTPLSDGSSVFALFGNGIGARYDLDGNCKWAAFIYPAAKGYGQSMSPALAGNVLGLHIDDDFFGVDFNTGKILWQAMEIQHQGSPVAVKAGKQQVFLSTDGSVFRPRDGKRLTKFGFPALNKFNTPIVRGNTAHWISEGRFLVSCVFGAKPNGEVTFKKGGRGIPNGVYYASAVIFDNKAALWNNVDYKLNKKTLYVVDLKSGKTLVNLKLNVGGWAYPTPTYAGGFLYVAGDKGECAVFRTKSGGKFDLKEIARNGLEPFRSCPVFEGDRMYIRGMTRLWCIKASAEDRERAAELLQ